MRLNQRSFGLATARDPASERKAFKDLLQYFSREPDALYQVGPISLWLCGGYPISRVEAMLEHLVNDGLLRHATKQELREHDCNHGYFLTTSGLAALPPEDRSYGII